MKKVLKVLTLCLVLTIAVPFTNSNAQLFDKGDVVLSAGFGLGTSYYVGASSIAMPTIFISGDYCLREDLGPGNLGVGAIMAYGSVKEDFYFLSNYDYRINSFIIGARGTYHFTDLVDQLDLYGGITLGGEIQSIKADDDIVDVDPESGVVGEFFAGARYYFTDDLSAMAELGVGITYIKLGISFKL